MSAQNSRAPDKGYALFVIDMFDYGESWPAGTFDTEAAAVAAAKRIIGNSFTGSGEEGYQQWLCFGEDVIIVQPLHAPDVAFQGQAFVKHLCGLSPD